MKAVLLFLVWSLAGAAIGGPAIAKQKAVVELRFCPSDQVRPYPLDEHGRLLGLMLPGVVVINRSAEPFQVTQLEISLLDRGRTLDRRVLDRPEIQRWVGNGPPLQKVMSTMTFEFCGHGLIPADVTLAGPILGQNQALFVANEVFAYDHVRDALAVTVRGMSGGRPRSLSATVPVGPGFAGTRFAFPLKGTWYVGVGPSFHTAHRAHLPEAFALDIARLGDDGKTHGGDGLRFADYLAYGAPVLAAADGRVVRVENSQDEDPAMFQRPGESAEAYAARRDEAQSARMAAGGPDWAVGNYVLLAHGNGEYSLYAHLQPRSAKVRPGDVVRAGDEIGLLGSSGNSSEPHLHFQVCDKPAVLQCAGIPVAFSNVSILWADGPRALQSGDIVTAR